MIGEAIVPTGNDITLLAGSSFCRSDCNGESRPDAPYGLFYRDTRIVSRWNMLFDGEPLEPLAAVQTSPFAATFIGRTRARPEAEEPTVLVERQRLVSETLREDIRIRNFGAETLGATLELHVGADFADLFDVKEGRHHKVGSVEHSSSGDNLHFSVNFDGQRRGIRVHGGGADASHDRLTWHVVVPSQKEWQTSVEVLPSVNGQEVSSQFPLDQPVDAAVPSQQLSRLRASTARFRCENPTLQKALDTSVTDLVSLRMSDSQQSNLALVAAGAPWFMALFGRDSLITSWLVLAWDPELARGTLHTLARLQGTEVNELSEEEPGRIPHEVRVGAREARALGASSVYYGSVDATPLFVMLLARAAHWGLPPDEVEQLLPHADRAIEWIENYGDLDGDGFVEYQRKTDRGLLNQAWKDSRDSMVFAHGGLASTPIAAAEVQAYVYGAYIARAELARDRGDLATATRCEQHAAELQRKFDDAFWIPQSGYYALALDGRKQQVDGLASNQGHCLWTGIAMRDRADLVAERLLAPDMYNGWGVRTLASSMTSYNPMSYHNGSVWPHDNALIVEGLLRYGRRKEAERIALSLIDASADFDGRLPELFCGFDRTETSIPVAYPTSCSPQAWAAATPIGLVSALLGIRPDLTMSPDASAPAAWGSIEVVGGHR